MGQGNFLFSTLAAISRPLWFLKHFSFSASSTSQTYEFFCHVLQGTRSKRSFARSRAYFNSMKTSGHYFLSSALRRLTTLVQEINSLFLPESWHAANRLSLLSL